MGGACSQKLKPRRGDCPPLRGASVWGPGRRYFISKPNRPAKLAHLAFKFCIGLTTTWGWVKSEWVFSRKRSRPWRIVILAISSSIQAQPEFDELKSKESK